MKPHQKSGCRITVSFSCVEKGRMSVKVTRGSVGGGVGAAYGFTAIKASRSLCSFWLAQTAGVGHLFVCDCARVNVCV